MRSMLHFRRHAGDRQDRIAVTIDTLIIGGWAGLDEAAIRHHFEELAAIGVPRPPRCRFITASRPTC